MKISPSSFVEELKGIHHYGEPQIRKLFDPKLNYQINLSEKQLNALNFRTLIIQGDRDEILNTEDAFTLYKNIPKAELWIVPNTGHIAISGSNQESFLNISLKFLSFKKN